ncbi:MAG: hypothetical protein WBI07_02105, partial [Mobilitalea sp.]
YYTIPISNYLIEKNRERQYTSPGFSEYKDIPIIAISILFVNSCNTVIIHELFYLFYEKKR